MQMFLALSRVLPHKRSWGGTRDKPKNVCVGGYRRLCPVKTRLSGSEAEAEEPTNHKARNRAL